MRKVVMAGALLLAAMVGGAASRYEGPRIAVVDMSRLMSQQRQSRDEQALIDQWRDANQKLLDEKANAYRAQVAELDQFKPGSDGWLKKSKELKVQKSALEIEQDSLQDEFDRKVAKSLADAHARVTAATRSYLEAHDLDAVLQYASQPVKGSKGSDVVPEIVVRTVVAWRGTVDATDAVLAILDGGK